MSPASGLAAVLSLAVIGPLAVRAQESAPTPVHWTAAMQNSEHSLQPGQKIDVILSADIDSGWHIYAISEPPGSPVIATEITVPDGQPLALSGDIKPPKPKSRIDPTIGKQTDLYENSAAFDLPLKVSRKARLGKQNLEIAVRYQACNDHLCLSPRTDKVEAPVEIHRP